MHNVTPDCKSRVTRDDSQSCKRSSVKRVICGGLSSFPIETEKKLFPYFRVNHLVAKVNKIGITSRPHWIVTSSKTNLANSSNCYDSQGFISTKLICSCSLLNEHIQVRGREIPGNSRCFMLVKNFAVFKRLSLQTPPTQFRVKNNFAWNSANGKTLPSLE